jgi:cytochrome P450
LILTFLNLQSRQGNETSAASVSNTILLLAMHPEYQAKVVAELKEVLVDQTGDLTNEQINQLVYCKQVINESMRLLYIVPLIARQLTGEVTLSNGVVLPAGCTFIIPIFSVHMRKDLWGEDAAEFRPERFDADVKRHPYQFLPFSAGTRMCIGYKYAYSSMVVMLAHLVRSYEFSTDMTLDTLERTFNVSMAMEKGQMVRIKKRTW